MKDLYGLDLSPCSDVARQGINDFVHGFIAFQPKAVNVIKAARTEPSCVLANAYAAWIMMLIESPAGPDLARPFAEAAAKAPANAREKAAVQIAQAWIDGDIARVMDLCEKTVSAYPRDLATLKLGQYHLFNTGDFPGMLRIATRAMPEAGDIAYTHGMLAFGYEECHLLDQAEAAARAALEIDPSEPWAHHALAHVYLTRGQTAEGSAFLESVAHHWEGLNSFMHSHNWWHLALFYLSLGRADDVLSVYDTHVWGLQKDYSQDQIGAASLLARMEFAGIDVGDRWTDLADHVAGRGADTVSPFLSLQYLYALCRAARPEARAMMDAFEARALSETHQDHAVWRDVAVFAARGIMAHANGTYDDAVRDLGKSLPRLAECGGSHAQRDLFEQIYLDALMRAGRLAQAQQVLEQRRHYDPVGLPLNRMLADIYDRNGLPDLAKDALARIPAAVT